MSDERQYQVAIIGGGPAGLAAGIYTTRAGLSTVLLERMAPGGQIINSEWVENYPGFPEGISGFDLGQLMEKQATKYGLKTEMTEVQAVDVSGDLKKITTAKGDFFAQAIIIAGGSEHAKLGIPGEDRLVGRGLSFCATCDGPFFRQKVTAVIGGGDVALTDALFLSRMCTRVYVIHRRDQLRASKILQERAFAESNIEFIWDTVPEAVEGEASVTGLKLKNVKTGGESDLKVDGVFMAVGTRPNTAYLDGVVKLAPNGSIPVNNRMETDIPGVFAAGDIRTDSIRQVVAAAGDGAVAALSAERYLTEG